MLEPLLGQHSTAECTQWPGHLFKERTTYKSYCNFRGRSILLCDLGNSKWQLDIEGTGAVKWELGFPLFSLGKWDLTHWKWGLNIEFGHSEIWSKI